MDGQKFDKLTRAFATGINRRSLLKILGGATVAGVAGVTTMRPNGALAQGSVQPGGVCSADTDCAQGFCVIQGDVGAEGICACTEAGLGDPWNGCTCMSGTPDPCGDSGYECCGATTAGGPGICQSSCDVVCSDPDSSCEETGCCTYGECGANGWCTSCISGTENPCGNLNEAFGANFICCSDGAEGSIGTCVTEAECVVEPPNTGAGMDSDTSNWIAPAAAIGAAAAVMAYKSREKNAESEA